MEGRGGAPHVFRATAATTGRMHAFKAVSKWMRIRVATFPCKVYFTEADFDDDINYITVPVAAADAPYGEWEGPIEASAVWLAGVGGGSVVELVAALRKN